MSLNTLTLSNEDDKYLKVIFFVVDEKEEKVNETMKTLFYEGKKIRNLKMELLMVLNSFSILTLVCLRMSACTYACIEDDHV